MTNLCRTESVTVFIFIVLFNVVSSKAQDIKFCSFSLPKGIQQAHTNFNAIYEFDVDKHGVPTNIKAVAKQFTNLEDVQSCIKQWKLPQYTLRHLVTFFEWQHGIGWTKLAISGPNIKLTIHLSCFSAK